MGAGGGRGVPAPRPSPCSPGQFCQELGTTLHFLGGPVLLGAGTARSRSVVGPQPWGFPSPTKSTAPQSLRPARGLWQDHSFSSAIVRLVTVLRDHPALPGAIPGSDSCQTLVLGAPDRPFTHSCSHAGTGLEGRKLPMNSQTRSASVLLPTPLPPWWTEWLLSPSASCLGPPAGSPSLAPGVPGHLCTPALGVQSVFLQKPQNCPATTGPPAAAHHGSGPGRPAASTVSFILTHRLRQGHVLTQKVADCPGAFCLQTLAHLQDAERVWRSSQAVAAAPPKLRGLVSRWGL